MYKTDKNQAEKDLRWNEERLHQLIENVKDFSIFITNLNGQIENWNLGAELIFGYKPEEIIGQSAEILFTPEDRAKGVHAQEMITAAEKGCAEDERWHIRKDGTRFYASGVQTPLYKDGKLTGFAKIARDLTERVILENALRDEQDNLEVKVKSRTSELKTANESLQLENTEKLKSQKTRTRLLHRIIATQEDERKRIARDLHDNLGQQIVALKLIISSIKEECLENSELCSKIEKAEIIAKRIDSEVDFLAWELRPTTLDDLGLVKATGAYVNEWSQHYKIPAEFQSTGVDGERMSPDVEINLYRITQEALNNVTKHSKANRASVLLERVDGSLVLIVEDDGIGFEPCEKEKITADDRGMGLLGMKERAVIVGGTLEIESAPGEGTTVYARVPLEINNKAELFP